MFLEIHLELLDLVFHYPRLIDLKSTLMPEEEAKTTLLNVSKSCPCRCLTLQQPVSVCGPGG